MLQSAKWSSDIQHLRFCLCHQLLRSLGNAPTCTNMHQLTLHTVGVAVSLCHLLLTLTCWSQPNIVFSRLQGIEAVFPSFRFTWCFPSEINGEQLFLQWWNVMGIGILLKVLLAAQPVDPPTHKWASMIKLNMLNGSLPCQSACRTNGHAVKEIHDIPWHSRNPWPNHPLSPRFRCIPMLQSLHCIGLLRATIHHLRRTGHIPYHHNCARGLIQCPSAQFKNGNIESPVSRAQTWKALDFPVRLPERPPRGCCGSMHCFQA